jgi:hypothetical protein
MMYLHLQIDNGTVTGVLQSSTLIQPDGGIRGLPPGRMFVSVCSEDMPELYDLPAEHWLGGTIADTKSDDPFAFTFTEKS